MENNSCQGSAAAVLGAIPNLSTARPGGFTSFPPGVTRILVQPGPSTIILELPSKEFDSPASSCQATPEKTTHSADSPSSGFEAVAETVDKTKLFVTLLTLRLLTKCRVLDICTEEELATYAKRLVNQTLQGLTVRDGFCPDEKDIKKICRAVIKDLTKKLGGKSSLNFVMLSEQPSVEAVIVKSLQANIAKYSTVSASKKTRRWRELLWPAMNVITACGLFFLAAIFL